MMATKIRALAAIACIASTAFFIACSKKEPAQPVATASGQAGKKADDPAIAKDLTEIQKDLSTKEFERATASMMRMQDLAPTMSAKDAERMQGQMRNLQTTIAQAASSGDPKAQSAIAMLRMMSRENQMPMRR